MSRNWIFGTVKWHCLSGNIFIKLKTQLRCNSEIGILEIHSKEVTYIYQKVVKKYSVALFVTAPNWR